MQPPFHWCVGAGGRIALQCGERDDLPPLDLVRSSLQQFSCACCSTTPIIIVDI